MARVQHEAPSAKVRRQIGPLEQRLTISRQSIWRWLKRGQFPVPHYLGARRVWWLDQIVAWENSRMRQDPAALLSVDRESTHT